MQALGGVWKFLTATSPSQDHKAISPDIMSSGMDMEHLRVCELHGLEFVDRLNSVPRLRELQRNAKDFLACILSTQKKIDHGSELIGNISVQKRNSVRAISKRCATCLNELHFVYDLYRRSSGWMLNSKEADRALVLDVASNPFDGICEILSYLTYILPCWSAVVREGQECFQAWEEWIKAASDNVYELERRIDIARELAWTNIFANELLKSKKSFQMTSCNNIVDSPHNGDFIGVPVSRSHGVWERLRQDLATEGILDDTIEKLEDRLKDFVRNLVQENISNWEPLFQDTASDDPTPETSTNFEAGVGFDASENHLDIVVVHREIQEKLDILLPANYDSIAPEIMEVALGSAKALKQTLRVMYESACRDPCRAAIYARFAKYLQSHTPPEIHESMPSQWAGKSGSYKGPVSSYFWQRCWGDWRHGKNGSMQIDLAHFALGLSSFIGQMVKYRMFDIHQVHLLLRRLLGSESPVGMAEFVAVYQLLRIVGATIEGGKRTSEEMSGHFERIDARVSAPGVPRDIKILGKELKDMRKCGWKALKTRAESKALDRAVSKIRDELSRTTG